MSAVLDLAVRDRIQDNGQGANDILTDVVTNQTEVAVGQETMTIPENTPHLKGTKSCFKGKDWDHACVLGSTELAKISGARKPAESLQAFKNLYAQAQFPLSATRDALSPNMLPEEQFPEAATT